MHLRFSQLLQSPMCSEQQPLWRGGARAPSLEGRVCGWEKHDSEETAEMGDGITSMPCMVQPSPLLRIPSTFPLLSLSSSLLSPLFQNVSQILSPIVQLSVARCLSCLCFALFSSQLFHLFEIVHRAEGMEDDCSILSCSENSPLVQLIRST